MSEESEDLNVIVLIIPHTTQDSGFPMMGSI